MRKTSELCCLLPVLKQLAPVVQKLGSAIHRIKSLSSGVTQLVSVSLIHWILIYPVGSAIQLLNNWGLEDSYYTLFTLFAGKLTSNAAALVTVSKISA